MDSNYRASLLGTDSINSNTPYKSLQAFEISEPNNNNNTSNNNNNNDDSLLRKFFSLFSDKQDEAIKIDPKMFFACERTYCAWFQSSLLVSSIGVGLATDKNLYAVGVLLIATGTFVNIIIIIIIISLSSSCIIYYHYQYLLQVYSL
jgi:hypothetical protein